MVAPFTPLQQMHAHMHIQPCTTILYGVLRSPTARHVELNLDVSFPGAATPARAIQASHSPGLPAGLLLGWRPAGHDHAVEVGAGPAQGRGN